MIFNPDNLSHTILYKKLELLCETTESRNEKQNIRKSLSLVDQISNDAIELMKLVFTSFPEYTLHDQIHLLNVTNIMGIILKESDTIDKLSYLEITALILSAFLHDIGMAYRRETVDNLIISQEFKLFKIERLTLHEGYNDIIEALLNPQLTPEEINVYNHQKFEIEKGILTEFLRRDHGKNGYQFIIDQWSEDPRWEFEGYNLSEIVATICIGHTLTSQEIQYGDQSKFLLDKIIGQNRINILYCTIILRLSDILDFDKKRTPNLLYHNISPKNQISVQEWNKHISVNGWKIKRDKIIFDCECTHPVYEKVLRGFLDIIDEELQICHNIVSNFPIRDEIADKYFLKLPYLVDRSKISAKDNCYSYMDLSFSLSHEDIMKLLMGEDFWGGSSLCIRELIQNAYDAIRHRRAVEKAHGNIWKEGKIVLTQRLNADGFLEFECKDNGMGMNREIIQKYFFNIGKSYYRSPEFKLIHKDLSEKDADFDPVSQFGIGIVSCFLIGKSLKIVTQKFLGYNRGCDERLSIDVSGFSQMAIIRVLTDETPEPGTKITILGKQFSCNEASDYFSDPLNLLETAQYHAAALDIPIEIVVESPFQECSETILPRPTPYKLKTYYELGGEIPEKYYKIIEKDLSQFEKNCDGTARIFFLIDRDGKIALSNEWCYFGKNKDRTDVFDLIIRSDGSIFDHDYESRNVISQDGILLCSNDYIRDHIHFYGTKYPSHFISFKGSYFVNLYGESKLPLKANRAPYIGSGNNKNEKIWNDFYKRLNLYISETLREIVEEGLIQSDSKNVWEILNLYDFSINNWNINWIFSNLHLPIVNANEPSVIKWSTLESLTLNGVKYVTFDEGILKDSFNDTILISTSGLNLNLCPDNILKLNLFNIVRSSTTLSKKNGNVIFLINKNKNTIEKIQDKIISEMRFLDIFLIEYSNELLDFLSINNPLCAINNSHQSIQYLHNLTAPEKDILKWFRWGLYFVGGKIAQDLEFDEISPEKWGKETINNVSIAIRNWNKVNWECLPSELQPPFNIYFPNSERIHEISLEYLKDKMQEVINKPKENIRFLVDLS